MSGDSNAPTHETATGTAANAGRSRSHRLARLTFVITVVLSLSGLLLFYAPRYVARYMVASELDKLGIDYEGVDTLSINPWTRELWLGPVRFGAGPSDRGQLGELGLNLRINPLLQHQVSIDRLIVRGIDVVVTRDEEDTLALNGITLNQFLPPPEAAAQPTEQDGAWGAGVDTFELRDSRLIFRYGEHGDLEIDVKRLALMDFRTWEPQRPGRFELAARVNDIQLNWSGEARPFADNITLAVDSRTEQADVPKVVRFTGPWGLDRREGTYDAELKYDVTLFDSGRLEGHTTGTIDIKGADYRREGVFDLALERAAVDLDIRYTLSESGDFTIKGQVAAQLGPSGATVAEETSFGVTAGRLVIDGLDAAYLKDGTLNIALRPDVELDSVEFSGPIEISFGQLLELLALLQSLSADGEVSTADTGLGDLADTSVALPRSDVKVGRLRLRGESFALRSNEGLVELDLQTDSDLFDIKIGVGERNIGIERIQSVLERLNAKSGLGRLALDMAGSNSLVSLTSASPIGELKIGAFEFKMETLGLQVQSGAFSLKLAAASQIKGVSAQIFAQRAWPELRVHLAAASAALSRASLDAQSDRLSWQAAGDASVDSLTSDLAKTEEGALKFSRAEIKVFQVNDRLQLAADVLAVDKLDLYVKRSLIARLVDSGGAGTRTTAPPVDAAVKPGVSAPTPNPEATAQEVDVARVQALLAELGYAPGPVDGRMGRRTGAAISDFQRREGLTVDGRLTGRLLAALESRAAGSGKSDSAQAPRSGAAEPPTPALRVGRVALTGNSVLRFRDDVVTPHVNADAVFKEAEVRNLDTRKGDQRTDVSLIADVNEFTHVELGGWVAGFGEASDLEIEAKVDNLELSTFSPYVRELAGVHLDSGRLDTATAATARQGALQGKIQIELEGLAFQPLSKEDAERVSGAVGVPLETAVDLLQDGDGRISLTMPMSGTLRKPEVDISSAVTKAMGGVLKKVFPPAMVASMLAGAAKGSGPTFEPIEFAPGSAALGEAGKRYADSVVELLAEHPKLSLKVCGRSTAQDMKQLTIEADAPAPPKAGGKGKAGKTEAQAAPDPARAAQRLAELAIERKRVVRRYLIQEQGAAAKRVPECRSTFEATDQGSPRVEISL